VNAANRTEGFCTLEGLPSDLLVRGDVNQNRAVEGDEVAVLAFKLQDWFKVYKEQEKVGHAAAVLGAVLCCGRLTSLHC
jgi:DIS3-like exonuclease 2